MKKMTKILSGSLLVALMTVGLVNKADVKHDDNHLEVHDVLAEDITKDNTGKVVRKVNGEAPEANLVMSNVKAQVSENIDGKRSIRFVVGIDSYNYENAAFSIDVNDLEGNLYHTYGSNNITTVYEKIVAAGQTLTAEEAFGTGYNYLMAFTINNVPEAYWGYTFNVTSQLDAGNENVKSVTGTKVINDIVAADEIANSETSTELYKSEINTAVGGAWIRYYLTWTDDTADIAEFVTASAIDGTIAFTGTLDYCNIDNENNKLQYGLAFGNAGFQGAVEHTLTVTIKTVDNLYYDVTTTFNGASGSGVDMEIVSTTTAKIEPIVVTLDAGEGTCETNSINVLVGGKYGTLPTASRSGYNFVGWYTDLTEGSIVTSGTVVTEGITTLYARYTEIAETSGVSYNATINTAVNGAWVRFYLTWTDDAADIAKFVTASSIDGTIAFAHTLDYCNIDNENNKLQYGLAFGSAGFQAAVEHTLTVTIETVNGETYDITVKFIGASGNDVDMVTMSTETTLVG